LDGRVLIRELHPSGVDADLEAVLPVWREFTSGIFRGDLGWGAAQLRMDTGPSHASDNVTLAAFADPADTEAAGFGFIRLDTQENLDLGAAIVMLRADQEQDADGAAAAALLTAARERLAALGRTKLSFTVPAEPPPGYAPLCDGAPVFTSICSVLDLAATDPSQLDAWSEPSPANAGYRMVRWIGPCPEDTAEAYAAALAAMHDAPHEDYDIENPHIDLDRLRASEGTHAKYGMQAYVVAALAADGEVAGSCMLARFPDRPDNLGIWNTSVTRAHRGHGLGLRIKAESTRWVRGLHPEARWIYTFNNHGNERMREINRRMGYRHQRTWQIYSRPVEAAAGPGAA
jgi:RimJ/RimL family protein N-acetyltransferase